jgi:hypothetical protein
MLQKEQKEPSVSSAYAFSVMASILGAAYSLLMVVNMGYNGSLFHAAACYLVLVLVKPFQIGHAHL